MNSDLFAGAETVTVSQSKEWLEIFTGFEQRNRFSVDFGGTTGALLAAEEGSAWARFFLGSARPYTLNVMHRDGKPALRLYGPFRFLKREIQVSAPDGKLLGVVRKRITFPHTRYDVLDAHERRIFEISRGILKVWTFTIKDEASRDMAVITKRWSGLGKEMFSDADRFQLQFPQVRDPVHRQILLGALFLIDLKHFEKGGD
jgi:uncharacterized protein YxjI